MGATSKRAKQAAAVAVFVVVAAAIATLARRGPEQRYTPEPDNLPNTPDRPAATTPAPTAR
jgi:hypothetical protein